MQTRSSLFRTLAILDLATSFWQVREKGETMNISRIRISDIYIYIFLCTEFLFSRMGEIACILALVSGGGWSG